MDKASLEFNSYRYYGIETTGMLESYMLLALHINKERSIASSGGNEAVDDDDDVTSSKFSQIFSTYSNLRRYGIPII